LDSFTRVVTGINHSNRAVSVEFFGSGTHLRVVHTAGSGGIRRGVDKILDNFQIHRIDSNYFLAIGRHTTWMLCDRHIAPIQGTIYPTCWHIMIQAHPLRHQARDPRSPIDAVHPKESGLESQLRATAVRRTNDIVPNNVSTSFEGDLRVGCIFQPTSHRFPCDGVVVTPLYEGNGKVGLPV
jgi:hypothetical protein